MALGKKRKQPDRGLYDWLQAVLSSVLAVVLVFTFGVRLVGVSRQSMRETLQNGDILLTVNRHLAGELKAGDIVVVKKEYFEDEKPIVKRIIATEGQTVDIDFDEGVVYVDGQALEEDYIREPTYLDEGLAFPIAVPEGCIFLLGDNRNNSMDSRDPSLGPVDVRCVIGKAVALVFPGKSAETEKREFSRIGGL